MSVESDAPATGVEALREHVMRATQHTTELIADLHALATALPAVVPELADATERERRAELARLAGLHAALPDHLAGLVEALADILAGLTADDRGAAWLEHQRARLAAGEEDASAA